MAINVVIPLLIPLEENIYNATRLLSGSDSPVQFSESRYCLLVAEDAPTALPIAKVSATHRNGESVRYSISGGNKDGLFTIDKQTGIITLAAALDYEAQDKHELVVTAEAGKANVQSIVQVNVADINDNPPEFMETNFHVTVIEEDHSHLPQTILKVGAHDLDRIDRGGLSYTVSGGDGAQNDQIERYFIVTADAELIQMKALDRDPPNGQESWQLKIQVRDGQNLPLTNRESKRRQARSKNTNALNKAAKYGSETFISLFSSSVPDDQYSIPYNDLENMDHLQLQTSKQIFQDADFQTRKLVSLNQPSDANEPRDVLENRGNDEIVRNDRLLPYQSNRKERIARRTGKYLEISRNSNGGQWKWNKHKGKSVRIKTFKNSSKHRGRFDTRENNSHARNYNATSFEIDEASMKNGRTLFADRFRRPRIRFLARKINHRLFLKRRSNITSAEYRDQLLSEAILESINLEDAFNKRNKFDDCHTELGCNFNEYDKGKMETFQNSTFLHEMNDASPSKDIPRHGIFQDSLRKGNEVVGEADLYMVNRLGSPQMRHKRRRIKPNIARNRPTKLTENDEIRIDNHYVKIFMAEEGECPRDYYDMDELSSYENQQGVLEFLDSLAVRTSSVPGGIHVEEVMVKVLVKDINDNAPIFPNETIFGDVQENGPIDLSVAVVSAWDADDETEGTNAQLTYSIEKNVVDERSGQAIFNINPDTGSIRTSICCLDRETTPEYHIQVVAVDGGGLKATSTVLVRLVDVNDNSPRLTRDAYGISINETWGLGPPDNVTLLKVTTLDHDTSNYFHYRVLESSGWGWEHFGVRTIGNKGELYALQTLDYEDPSHRRGFRFIIQVTDRGRGGWSDPRHTHSAWVKVNLLDLNDNPPEFLRPHAHVTVREDTAPGKLLVTIPAYDRDMDGKQGIRYRITGGWGSLKINDDGGVVLWRSLDREMDDGEMGIAKIIGIDEGHPSLTSTATLTIIVTDVNDTPPRLLPPTVLHVQEGAPSSFLGLLTATDDDVWTLGHGPPFRLSLSSSNPPLVKDLVMLKFDSGLDSGRGGGELWSLKEMDREEFSHLMVEIKVSDAGGVSTTYPVTVIIDDINDNPMKPASKTVYLWKTQGGISEACLGRVYVEDPDDWDLKDKTFSWLGPPHPLFTLDTQNGMIYAASNQLTNERYDLTFSVSDYVWSQEDVGANVTVIVNYLTQEALAHSVPITLSPTTPSDITAGWTPKTSAGGLGMLISSIKKVLNMKDSINVEVVSIFGQSSTPSSPKTGKTSNFNSHPYPTETILDQAGKFSSVGDKLEEIVPSASPFACVWVCVRYRTNRSFMNPLKLHGLLSLNMQQLEESMKLKVRLEDPLGRRENTLNGQIDFPSTTRVMYSNSRVSSGSNSQPSSVASLASKTLPLQVVDNNSTSLVTPRLTRTLRCDFHTLPSFDPNCTPSSCLNGGRCVGNDRGSRCICPGGSSGHQCKVLSRSFSGHGWAWVDPLPPCLPTSLSFKVLTTHSYGLLLYSGPLTSTQSYPHQIKATQAIFLQIMEGRPQVVLLGLQEPIVLTLNSKIDTGTWHHIHLYLDSKGMYLMTDYCGKGWLEGATNDSHCIAMIKWENPKTRFLWDGGQPLQLGGLAHPRPSTGSFGWSIEPVLENLQGCISNLKINGQFVDLGEPAFSSNSDKGCSIQNRICSGGCGFRGKCVSHQGESSCSCDAGWTGHKCSTPTIPSFFNQNSYVKIALSFTPDPYSISTQLRMKTQGDSSGVLLQLAAQHGSAALTVKLHNGLACASVTGSKEKIINEEICVYGHHLGDGEWHLVRVERHGRNIMVAIDDGDNWLHNETIISILNKDDKAGITNEPPVPLFIDKQDGVTVGGLPEYLGVNSITVHKDLNEICIDDVRVSDNPLPMPPAVNGTTWGQITTLQQLESGCPSHPENSCANTSCLPPLACHPSWRYSSCSCGPDRHLVNGKCQDIDECSYDPCLHGGSCYNLLPGYECTCGSQHSGHNCQWENLPDYTHPLTSPVVLAALTLSLLMIVVFVIVIIRLHRWRAARGVQLPTGAMEHLPEVETVAEVVDTSLTIGELHVASPDKDIMYLSSLQSTLPSVTSISENKNTNLLSHQTSLLAGENDSNNGSKINSQFGSPSTFGRSSNDQNFYRKRSLRHSSSQEESIIPKGVLLPLPAQDDLRAYAYEGDGSPDSLTSALIGLCSESSESSTANKSTPESRPAEAFKAIPDISTIPTNPHNIDVFITTNPITSEDLPKVISSTVTHSDVMSSLTNSPRVSTLERNKKLTGNLQNKDHNITC